jgi:hypothetical protein
MRTQFSAVQCTLAWQAQIFQSAKHLASQHALQAHQQDPLKDQMLYHGTNPKQHHIVSTNQQATVDGSKVSPERSSTYWLSSIQVHRRAT